LDSYLSTRRALGFKLVAPAKTLDAFVDWMDSAGEPTIRRDLAAAWVSQFSRQTVLERLNHIKQFAEHVAWFDPTTQIPILDGQNYGSHRARPLIFTGQQADALLAAAGRLTPRVRAASWQTLLGLGGDGVAVPARGSRPVGSYPTPQTRRGAVLLPLRRRRRPRAHPAGTAPATQAAPRRRRHRRAAHRPGPPALGSHRRPAPHPRPGRTGAATGAQVSIAKVPLLQTYGWR